MIFQDFTTDQLQRIAAATANLHGEARDAPEAADARTATEGEQWDFTGWRMVYETVLDQIASRSMTGTQAIEYARQHGLLLATVADADYGVRYGFSPEEAALQDPAKVQLDPNTIISTKAVLAQAGRCVVCGAPATHVCAVCAGCADVRCDVHENHVRLSSCRDIGGRPQAAAFGLAERLRLPLRT